jgi:hypothetical protein
MPEVQCRYRVEHQHYHRLDPSEVPELALFKVFDGETLVAVVREPSDGALIGEPEPNKNYRVDCRAAPATLRSFLKDYLPAFPCAYFEDARWAWRDNGTYEPRR